MNTSLPRKIDQGLFLKWASIFLLLIPYVLYLVFIIRTGHGPVDYETFMEIGQRLLRGGEVYTENSYYPLPYVMIFAGFSWLPRPISILIWFSTPVITALLLSGGNPLILLFAPLFGHFVGGQTAYFAMLGLGGYRKNQDVRKFVGGVFLALLWLKPQLGIVALAFACVEWARFIRSHRQLPQQATAWAAAMVVIYLPAFLVMPDWPMRWLSHPRPLFERAMAAFVPRTLLYLLPTSLPILYGLILAAVGASSLYALRRFTRKPLTLDQVMLWGFLVNPLVHDYDLIQLIPLLQTRWISILAVVLSIPGWVVILFAYSNDSAWYVFTLIAPGLLGAVLYQNQKEREHEALSADETAE